MTVCQNSEPILKAYTRDKDAMMEDVLTPAAE